MEFLKTIYSDTWHLYKKTLPAVIPFSAIIAIITTVVPTSIILNGPLQQYGFAIMLFFIIGAFINLIPTAAIFHQIVCVSHGNKQSLTACFKYAMSKFNNLALASMLYVAYIMGCMLVGTILAFAFISLTHNNIFVSLFFLPIFAAYICFYFYKPLIILFDHSPTESLSISFKLVKNHIGQITLGIILPLIAIFIFNLGLSYVGNALFIDNSQSAGTLNHQIAIINEIVSSIVGIISVPFLSCLSLVLLKERTQNNVNI